MTAAAVIRGALELLGPNGENWSSRGFGHGDPNFCIMESLVRGNRGHDPQYFWAARALVIAELPEGHCAPMLFNDDNHTMFGDIQLTLKRALHRAEEAGI